MALDYPPPWTQPPATEPAPRPLDSGLTLQVPSGAIQSFKLIASPPAWRDVEALLGESERAAVAAGAESIPALVDRMRSAPTQQERFAAAAALRAIPGGTDALASLAMSHEGPVRIAAIAGLPLGDAASVRIAMRALPPPTLEDSWAWCRHAGRSWEQFELRDVVSWHLHVEPGIAVGVLEAALGCADEADRRGAAQALLDLSKCSVDEGVAVRARAALAAVERDPDPVLRWAAIVPDWGFADEEVPMRRPRAIEALTDPDLLVRNAALVALSWDGDDPPPLPRRFLGLLQRLARDESEARETRTMAAGFALQLASTKPELEVLLHECDFFGSSTCGTGASVMEERPHPLQDWAWDLAFAPRPDRGDLVGRMAGYRGFAPPPRQAAALLASPDAALRADLLLALAHGGPRSAPALPDVLARLEDPDERVRREAVQAVTLIAPDDVGALERAASAAREAWGEGAFTLQSTEATARRLSTHANPLLRRAAETRLSFILAAEATREPRPSVPGGRR